MAHSCSKQTVDVVTSSGRRIPGAVAGYDHGTGFGLVRTVLPMEGRALELGESERVLEKQTLLTQGQARTRQPSCG
jgi:RNA-splicing ligase RtcB